MANVDSELNALFHPSSDSTALLPEIMLELQSILRLHSVSAQELFFKWESYSMKMGSEETKLNLDTVRAFKKDLQEILEREARVKGGAAHMRNGGDRRSLHATPRSAVNGGGRDVFGTIDGLVPSTPRTTSTNGSIKRKGAYETPSTASKISRSALKSSPTDGRATAQPENGGSANSMTVPFTDRQNAGQIVETLNDHLDPVEPPIAPPADPRVRLMANTDLKKFYYKGMAMHLSEASEILDDRIDDFMMLVQAHHNLEDSAFGNAASRSTNEIVAVGRIASDTLEGKLNIASMVLEMSRRMGAGLRIPLKVDKVQSSEFFSGQIIAVRGINASGEYFSVTEVLEVPLLPPAASLPSSLDAINERFGLNPNQEDEERPSGSTLNVILASGPYTADDNLSFEPLHALCDKASETCADVLILVGPLLDIEHPLVASGDFDLPDDPSIQPDKATLSDLFRILIGDPLRRLAQSIPSITIILVPSVRDAVNKHVSWPQEPFPKRELGLPKQARMVSNPVTISLNEIVLGISAQDILYDLRREEVVVGQPKEPRILNRLPRHLMQQRHFFPLFPPTNRTSLPKTGTDDGLPTGMPLDISYLKLGEWLNVRPDIAITPSALSPFAKVIESTLFINPGSLSKRRGPGTYAQICIHPRKITQEERAAEISHGKMVGHRVFERARVDIVRI